jgi:hypothetical protein
MLRHLLLYLLLVFLSLPARPQSADKANAFLNMLDAKQKAKTVYPFDAEERYRFFYVPRNDRKGIALEELTAAQQTALMEFLKTGLTDNTVQQVNDIIQLENVLRELEGRNGDDRYRDPRKYFVTIFGTPSTNSIWGWRFEGHHISFNFSANKKDLVAGTPAFMGSNPALILGRPQKNKVILKEETDKGFALINALSADEIQKAVVSDRAPGEIITGNDRKAMIDKHEGIRYSELSAANQQLLLQLIEVYIQRYTKLFADDMLKAIQHAGVANLWFTWAGDTKHTPGKAYYYRIEGPTIIIEYDNSQNNANHIHTVVRDLTNDFGGDLLLQHYKSNH